MPTDYAGITLVAEQSQVAHKYTDRYLQDHTGDSALRIYLTFKVMILLSDLNAQRPLYIPRLSGGFCGKPVRRGITQVDKTSP